MVTLEQQQVYRGKFARKSGHLGNPSIRGSRSKYMRCRRCDAAAAAAAAAMLMRPGAGNADADAAVDARVGLGRGTGCGQGEKPRPVSGDLSG